MPDLIQIYHVVQELGAFSLIDHRRTDIMIMMQTQGLCKTRIEIIVKTQESCKIFLPANFKRCISMQHLIKIYSVVQEL